MGANAQSSEPTAKMMRLIISSVRRPKRSATSPVTMRPNAVAVKVMVLRNPSSPVPMSKYSRTTGPVMPTAFCSMASKNTPSRIIAMMYLWEPVTPMPA